MSPDTAIEAIAAELRNAPQIRALFLSGSYGCGLQDAWSDIDFVVVAVEGATDDVARMWHTAVSRTGTIVLWWDRGVRPLLINAITEDWLRVDALILKPDQLRGQTQDRLRVVFDHDRLFDGLPKRSENPPPDPERQRRQFEEFIRILGLLPLALGREEHLNGVLGVFHLRNLLVDLLVEETGAAHRGGALHLNRLISDEQKAILLALPAPVPTRDGLIAAHLAYAEAYLPRARNLAIRWGVDWPERFEAVTWERLRETLSIERPSPSELNVDGA